MMNNLGIYIHIPFCLSKCKYCDFYSIQAEHSSIIKDYVQKIKSHIDFVKEEASDYTIDSIYFGGGTPSILEARLLCEILEKVRQSFHVSEFAEITLEANPKTVSKRELQLLNDNGFNRISIGVQSSVDRLLDLIGRVHHFEDAVTSIENAANAGFTNISADLMYNLPTQTVEEHLQSIDALSVLPLNHISMYGLKIEPNTPFGRDRHLILPDEDTYCSMYLEGVSLLSSYGYRQYEISNFSKKGFQSKHNLKYWNREEYLGFGPGAHSFFKGKRFYCKRDLKEYMNSFVDQLWLSENVPTEKEKIEEELFLKLRLSEGISYDRLSLMIPNHLSYTKMLINGGFAHDVKHSFALTPKGMLVSNNILSDFLVLLDP